MPPSAPRAPSTYSSPSIVTTGMSPGIVEEARTRTMSSSMVPVSARVNQTCSPVSQRKAPKFGCAGLAR